METNSRSLIKASVKATNLAVPETAVEEYIAHAQIKAFACATDERFKCAGITGVGGGSQRQRVIDRFTKSLDQRRAARKAFGEHRWRPEGRALTLQEQGSPSAHCDKLSDQGVSVRACQDCGGAAEISVVFE